MATTLLLALPLPGGDLYLRNPLVSPLLGLATKAERFMNFGTATSSLLPYLFLFAGIILLAMLIAGGFTIMTALGNEEKMTNGKTRITHALIGFLALFGVYWLAQIVQILFKIPIL